MTDFNTPTNTTTYTSVLATLNDKIASVAKMLFSSDTNIPVGTLQYNRTTRLFEEWNGSSWTAMRVEQAGVIKAFGGASAPTGHVLCDGSAYNTYTHRELHKIISNIYGGTAYSAGVTDQPSAVTTFNVPDLRRRFAAGVGGSDTLGNTEGGNNTGTTYGSRSLSHSHDIAHSHTTPTHQHTVLKHSHGLNGHTHTVNSHSHTVFAHSHPLSSNGWAQFQMENSSTFWKRLTGLPVWTATVTKAIANTVTGNTTSQSHGIALDGDTDMTSTGTSSEAPGTGGPVGTSITGGSGADTTDYLTKSGEGALTTDTQSTATSGPATPPLLFVNYIITI